MGNTELLIKGTAGVISPVFAIAISLQSTIAALQIISLAVGIAVGIATFISIVKGKNK